MLLALRSLWEAATDAVEAITTGTRKNRKIQRKLQRLPGSGRLAQWSAAIAPPRRPDIVIDGEGFLLQLHPVIASTGSVFTTRHVAIYSKGVLDAGIKLAPFIGIDVSVSFGGTSAASSPWRVSSSPIKICAGELQADIDLFEDEYLALMAIMAG